MKLFNKKERCVIVVDEETNLKIQRFADEHCIKGSIIDITKNGELCIISFDTKSGIKNIIKQLRSKFELDFNVDVKHELIFVTNK